MGEPACIFDNSTDPRFVENIKKSHLGYDLKDVDEIGLDISIRGIILIPCEKTLFCQAWEIYSLLVIYSLYIVIYRWHASVL